MKLKLVLYYHTQRCLAISCGDFPSKRNCCMDIRRTKLLSHNFLSIFCIAVLQFYYFSDRISELASSSQIPISCFKFS